MTAPAITSTFDADTEGWSMQGDVQSFTWQSSGGDPGGHLAWVDAATGANSYWLASSDYLGDKSAYYGGSFSYDIEDSGNTLAELPDVELIGGGSPLIAWSASPPTTLPGRRIQSN